MPDSDFTTGRFINSGPSDAVSNMALDDALFELCSDRLTMRVYSWEPPALSLGYFQPYSDFARYEDVYSIVRRVTGGGAIFHAGEFTYSLTCRIKSGSPFASIPGTYKLVHGIFTDVLGEMGYKSEIRGKAMPCSDIPGTGFCFHKSADVDVMLGERKLIGSAQRRSGGKLLMHGSLIIGRNPLTEGVACLTEDSSAINRLHDEISSLLQVEIERRLGLRLLKDEPSEQEHRLAESLAIEKFKNPAWTMKY